MALRCFAMIANGTGGVDWSALPLAAAYYGAQDMDALIGAMLAIKLHRPPTPGWITRG